MVILVYYVTLYVLPLVHRTPQKTKKRSKSSKKWMFPAWLPWLRNLFLIFFLLILIGLDQTVILVYYTTFYMHSLNRGTPKTLKNRQNGQKWLFPAWLPWLRKIFFNFFLLILIGLDYMVILVYYVTLYVLPLVHRTPQKTKKRSKSSQMVVSCLVTMVTENIFQFFSFDPHRA